TEATLWVLGVFWTLLLIYKGFDTRRILFSFSLTFIVIVSIIYDSIILIVYITGLPRAIAFATLPLVIAGITGYFKDIVIASIRARRKIGIYVPLSKRFKTTVYKLDPIMWVFVILGLTILVVFLITPLALVLYHAFEVPPGTPLYENFRRIFLSHLDSPFHISRYVRLSVKGTPWRLIQTPGGDKILLVTGVNYGVLLNSLINAAMVTSVATVLGTIVGFVLARYSFPGRNIVRILAMIPLFVTPFVNAYVIKVLFSPEGPISMITQALFGWKIRIDSLAGVALAQIMAFYPIVYLNAYSSFLNLDPSMEEQGENLGARGLKLFFTVTLPLALPGIIAGSIIVFIFSLEDLGAPIIFQEENLISYQIYSSFVTEQGIVSPEIAALGIVLLLLAAAGFIAIRSYVSMRSYAMISRGGRWILREHRLGLIGKLLVYLLLVPLIIFTALPQIGVILLAFNIMPPYGFQLDFTRTTPEYFITLFRNPDVFLYIRNTLTYATLATILATIIAIMVAYSVSRVKIRGLTSLIDTLATIPLAVPGLVIALGYFYFFAGLPSFLGQIPWIGPYLRDAVMPLNPVSGPTTFQAWIVLIIAYSIRKLPFVVRSVYAGFQQVHEALEEAALNLGASRSRVIFGVILPFIATYIVSGAVIGFIYMSTEVSTSITIGGLRPDQAPMTFYMMNMYKGHTVYGVQIAASMGVLLILFQLMAIFLIVVVFKQRYAFIGA
ncbi:MAG: iron ABC transporter permease, partial [Thermoprotei archaeon]